LPENNLYMSFTINCFIKRHMSNNPYTLQHTRPQLLLYGAGLHGFDVDFLNSFSDYFVCLSISASDTTLIKKERQLQIDLTFVNRL
jgi:hypothetical protein